MKSNTAIAPGETGTGAPRGDLFLPFGNIINGQKITDAPSQHHSLNPWTGERLWDAPITTERDVQIAVLAASATIPYWAALTFEERGSILVLWANKIQENCDMLASLLQLEGGKPPLVARNEIDLTVINIKKYSRFDVTKPETLYSDGRQVTLRRVPRGVTLAITPFNFPVLIGAGKISAALMAGCPIIVKPSPFTPYSTLKITELALGIIPDGVLQVLGGRDQPGPWLAERLISDPAIDVISFTGSAGTARKVRITAANSVRPKRVIEELGGNNPTIVCPGVDVPKVAREIVEDFVRNCGQVCVSSSRVYIPEVLYQEFVNEMSVAVDEYMESGKLGPIQNIAQFERIRDLLQECHAQNLRFVVGGVQHEDQGFFVTPTIVDNPPQDSKIANNEAFGTLLPYHEFHAIGHPNGREAPLASLFPYSDIETAIELANRGNMNLAACVYSPSSEVRDGIARKLQAGTIFHNSFARPKGDVPMPGCGGSGIGNEGGLEGVKEFCRLKVEFHSVGGD